jgi:AcrR family transcriptional regulator
MQPVKPSRRYRSPRRAATARTTRCAILDAARELFITQGYAATSIDQIAERAQVSKPTVFASVGSKRVLLKELRDIALAGDEEPVPVPERAWVQELLAEPDQRQTLRLYARGSTQLQARYVDLEEVVHAAAGAEAALRELWQTNEQERLVAARFFVDNLLSKGPLRAGLDREAAADVLSLYMATDNFRRLVRGRGWDLPRFEQWLATTLCEQLLGAS